VARRESAFAPALPPIPATREFPPIPERPFPVPAAVNPEARSEPAPSRPVVPVPPPRKVEPAPPKPSAPPAAIAPAPTPVAAPVPSPAAAATELRPAPFFLRGIAFFVDCGVIFSPVVVLFVLGMLSIEVPTLFRHESAQAIAEQKAALWHNTWRMAGLLAIGCGWLYASWYESSRDQATIGKRWMRLKVVDELDERISFLRATGRYLAKYVSALPCFLGFAMALFSSRGRALHDRLSGTRVVRD
jgi:uncharacterized RDD family membrane protein YckC